MNGDRRASTELARAYPVDVSKADSPCAPCGAASYRYSSTRSMAGHSCGKALRTSFMRRRWLVVTTWWPRSPKPWCCGVYAEPF
eukprot:9828725-Alexandrium_andersonii.AAC.1